MKIRTRREVDLYLFPGDTLNIMDGGKLLHRHEATEFERISTILTVDVNKEADLESGIGVILGEKA